MKYLSPRSKHIIRNHIAFTRDQASRFGEFPAVSWKTTAVRMLHSVTPHTPEDEAVAYFFVARFAMRQLRRLGAL